MSMKCLCDRVGRECHFEFRRQMAGASINVVLVVYERTRDRGIWIYW